MSFFASLHKELLDLARTHRLLVLAVVLVFFGLFAPLFAKLTPELVAMLGGQDLVQLIPEPTMADAVGEYVDSVTQFGVLLALLLTMGTVAQEKERGTAVLMLVKPLPRSVFLLAKFVSLALAFLVCLIVAALGGYYYTLILFEAPSAWGWVQLNLLLWAYMLVYVALTLLASVLTRSQAAAAGLGFGALLLLAALGAIPGLSPYLPAQLVAWGRGGVFDPGVRAWPSLWASLCLIVASLAAAWLLFRHQEL